MEKTEKLFEINEVEGTPFAILRDELGYCVLLGKYQVTEKKETKEETLKLLEEKDWNLILSVAVAQMKIMEELKKEEEIINKNKKEETCKSI